MKNSNLQSHLFSRRKGTTNIKKYFRTQKTCFHNFQGLNLNFFQAKLFAHWNLHSILYKVNKPWHFMKFFLLPLLFRLPPFLV